MRWLIAFRFIVVLMTVVACAAPPHAQTQEPPAPAVEIAELWHEPVDLLERDLAAGPGGAALTPPADGRYEFVAFKTSGTNPGYDVRDASGRIWSVKLGVEAQSEVTTSRILWALGFHQPATYYLPQFTLSGADAGTKLRARFRADVEPWKSTGGDWSWYENPFVETQPFRGLIVAQLLLNSWDLKASNNRIYEATDVTLRPRRRFVVRDVGASLGHSKQFVLFSMLRTRGRQGSKNDIDGFEQQGFIKRVEGNRVIFDYRGMNQALVDVVTVPDVIWACELFARIPDGHWQAAFRAGGYSPELTERYIRKIKEKIGEGLALRPTITG